MTLFNPTLHTIVSTNVSDYVLGAIFSQVSSDGIEQTVAFASRTLPTAERKYATMEKEVLAWVWAIERWRTYHQALTTLLTTKGIICAGLHVARWSLLFM